jgi:cation diffusion facilitator CzcD-associated flavoprotein CzcO
MDEVGDVPLNQQSKPWFLESREYRALGASASRQLTAGSSLRPTGSSRGVRRAASAKTCFTASVVRSIAAARSAGRHPGPDYRIRSNNYRSMAPNSAPGPEMPSRFNATIS